MLIPYRICTPRLLLRCWKPSDAAKVVEAIAANLDHLRPWLAWAWREPEAMDEKAKRLSRWRQDFLGGRGFMYGVFSPDEARVLGAIGCHRHIGAGAAELGYWIRKEAAGQGLMTEAAGALTRVAFEVQRLVRVEIHCHPENRASSGVARRLGFLPTLTIRNCVWSPDLPPRDTEFWSMAAARYAKSRAAGAATQVVDPVGTRLL